MYKRGKWDIWYSTTENAVNMMQLIDIKNSTDPLNIYRGNPNLKNSRGHNISLTYSYNIPQRKFTHSVYVEGHLYHNSIVFGYTYNPLNGVRSHSYYNVNGNRDVNGNYQYTLNFGRGFRLSSMTSAEFGRNVDMVGSSNVPVQRYINRNILGETIKLTWETGKNRFSINGKGFMNRYSSKDPGFNDFTSWTWTCSASTMFHLPYNWEIGTDLTFYGRRGFSDPRLNTSELIWNARLSKTILKGSMTLTLDAYDILKQLDNVSYTVNARARTESVSNVIPSYLLFHIQYRFNHQPKR